MSTDLNSFERVPLLSFNVEPSQGKSSAVSSHQSPQLQTVTYSPSRQQFGGADQVVSAPTSRCLICLDDHLPVHFSRALRCAHPVCEPCLRELWERNVMTDSEPFPRCPMPGCDAYASDAAASSLLSSRVAKRMRQLRSLKPARAADGRRLYCIADGCFEQLPPPVPKTVHAGQEPESEEEDEEMVSTCPDCGTPACMRCGCRAHPGTACAAPLLSARQRRMYNAYAVGRVSACPRCGVHVERDGGCSTISCARCKWSFTFHPFRSTEEVEQAAVVEDFAIPEPPAPTVWGNAFAQLFRFAYFMVWGTGFGALAFVALVETLVENHSKSPFRLDILLLVPFVVFGIPVFLISTVRFLVLCIGLLRHVGHPAPTSVHRAICMLVLSVILLVLEAIVAHVAGVVVLWQWLLFFLPFILCGVFLLAIASTHLAVLGSRAVWMRWQEWQPVENSGESDVTEDAPAEVGQEMV